MNHLGQRADSQKVIPLATITAQHVTHLYDLMDVAYSAPSCARSENLGHVPLINHNPRCGEKFEFAPHTASASSCSLLTHKGPASLGDRFGHLRGQRGSFLG